MSTAVNIAEARRVLQTYFGYEDFRPGQTDVIESLLCGRDTIGILPTGGGKSICYQVPAMMQERLTVVVSPLISLMKDQVDTLEAVGIAATYINSTLARSEVEERISQLEQGRCRLVYVAPERLESPSFRNMLTRLKPSFVAIDEAHCVSQWGHDFRPSYRAIAPFIDALQPRPLVAAYTATATQGVIEDISRLLALRSPNLFVSGFDRENLYFSVVRGQNKRDFVLDYIRNHQAESGIIYAATRKEVDQLHAFLEGHQFQVARYHAGLSDKQRAQAQEAFLYDDVQIMVATNAFGMGIDKSNVRYVVHYNMPSNVEAYYQEAGRAGRDGERGECILLYSPQDVQVQKFLIEQNGEDEVRRAQEYKRLQTMVNFCHTGNCLRGYILEYFGDSPTANCGNCSNCAGAFEEQDITVEAQQIFSCIFRTKERFGATLIAGILKGSKSKRIRELGLDSQTTYGLMQQRTEKDITRLIQMLIADGYLRLEGGQYPVVHLTPQAIRVLKDGVQVSVRMPVTAERQTADEGIFEDLRALRRTLALEANVPPYVIFSDATLREMARLVPQTERALRQVKGVGEQKLIRYGARFLDVLQEYAGEAQGEAAVAADEAVRDAGEQKTPSFEVTYEMYKNGLGIEEIARERGLSKTTIEGHVVDCAKALYSLNWRDFVSEDEERAILDAAEQSGSEKLKPIKELLPEQISYFAIRLALLKKAQESD